MTTEAILSGVPPPSGGWKRGQDTGQASGGTQVLTDRTYFRPILSQAALYFPAQISATV